MTAPCWALCAKSCVWTLLACCIACGGRGRRASADDVATDGGGGARGEQLTSTAGGRSAVGTSSFGETTSGVVGIGGAGISTTTGGPGVAGGAPSSTTGDSQGVGGSAASGEPASCRGLLRVYTSDDNLCFDAHQLDLLDDPGEGACTFSTRIPLPLEFDFDRLRLFYVLEGDWFELQRVPGAESCSADAGGFYLGYDEAGEQVTHVNVCACSCDPLREADLVSLLTWCE